MCAAVAAVAVKKFARERAGKTIKMAIRPKAGHFWIGGKSELGRTYIGLGNF